MTAYFLDSSAVVKRYVPEPDHLAGLVGRAPQVWRIESSALNATSWQDTHSRYRIRLGRNGNSGDPL